jgi:hypothetical protein
MFNHFSLSYRAHPFIVLQCLAIFRRATVLSLLGKLSHSSCYTAQLFSTELQCSAIFYCYSAPHFAMPTMNSVIFATALNHFIVLPAILDDSVRHFAMLLGHFMILSAIIEILSVILLQCLAIL